MFARLPALLLLVQAVISVQTELVAVPALIAVRAGDLAGNAKP